MSIAMRQARIYRKDMFAGLLTEDGGEYTFKYDESYLASPSAEAISLTLPLQDAVYRSPVLFPFFDGLIPEGWLLDIAEKSWKLNPRDRMGLLLSCCRKCIGAVSVVEVPDER